MAALEADEGQYEAVRPVTGLFLYAAYPPHDMSTSLDIPVASVSASRDALATPEVTRSTRANLPPRAGYVVVDGAAHAQFGAYGEQPGDGSATIDDAEARRRISDATLRYLDSVDHS